LTGFPIGKVQVAAFDHNVVLPMRIVGIQAQRVVGADVADVGRAHSGILPREAEAPAPLLAMTSISVASAGNRDELVPRQSSRAPTMAPTPTAVTMVSHIRAFVSGL